MAIQYQTIVPWGRSYDEYVAMFGLTTGDLEKPILGCGDGPASFSCGMKQRGKRVVAIDPIYQFSAAEIAARIEVTYADVIAQTRQNAEKFVWGKIKDVEALGEIRMKAMQEFLRDYEAGKQEGRYVFAQLPELPFGENQFDLALASHFLFLYTDNLTLDFHLQAIGEMLRVAGEVRIFPLLDVNAVRSPYVDEIIKRYSMTEYQVEEVKVDYEFQKGGNTMLRICRKPLSEMTNEELWQLFPIVIQPYEPVWRECYLIEKTIIEATIGNANITRISHFGSTSVPGLPAKPTIDILVELKEDTEIETLIDAMTTAGYLCSQHPQNPAPHLLFKKGYTPQGYQGQVYHIHVRYRGDWDELYFRDYLLTHPEVAAEYGRLKAELAQRYKHDRDEYTNAKTDFIRRITGLARAAQGK